MNAQNAHILKKLDDVKEAIQALMQADLTVTHIAVEGAYPRINLLSAPRNRNQLPISWKVIRKIPGGRETETAACVNGCEIRWLERT